MLEVFKRGFRRLRQGGSGRFDLILTVLDTEILVVLLAHPLHAQAVRVENTSYSVIGPPLEHPFTMFRYGGVSL